MRMRSRTLLTLLVAGLVVAAAACGDDDDAPDAANAPDESAATTAASASDRDYGGSGSGGATGGTVTVEVADSDLGEILAVSGATLYAFLPDNAGASTCSGDCAANWPPLMADTVEAGDGLDSGDFATAARDEGNQVTFHGWPLYYFAGDVAPGDTSGQGLGASWYVVAPDGTLVGT